MIQFSIFVKTPKKLINQDTICAISTPPGNGAIAVIRLSGDKAIQITDKIFHPGDKKKLAEQPANTLHYGTIKDKDKLVDEVVVSLFHSPNSYTGEDVVEISCHGATYIQQLLLQLLINHGTRLAKPGEFTMRAFLNGKMDLSQAEGVADLIASSSAASHRIALKQMRGGFSEEIKNLRNKLLDFISLIELELDFSEEDVEFADRKELKILISRIYSIIHSLSESFSLGNVIKNGVPVAIVGKPNVGKSTLLNALLSEEKAIVSEIEGTTRDAIEDTVNIEGNIFRFIDTAGLRETSDFIENLGIRKTYQKIGQSKIVLLLVDASDEIDIIYKSYKHILKQTSDDDKDIIVVVNKADLLDKEKLQNKFNTSEFSFLRKKDSRVIISAKDQKIVHKLAKKLVQTIKPETHGVNDIIITNIRHYEALVNTGEALLRVKKGMKQNISNDLLAQDIREALHYLGEITGEITTDEILGNIFKNFCIGK